MALVAVAEVVDDLGRPLVGIGQEHSGGMARVDLPTQELEELLGLGQVLSVRAVKAGTHDELLVAGGDYAELFDIQARAYR